MAVAKAQQVDGEAQVQAGKRRGIGSVAVRRCQMGCQGDIEKMVTAQYPNLWLRAGKGERSWKKKITLESGFHSIGNYL